MCVYVCVCVCAYARYIYARLFTWKYTRAYTQRMHGGHAHKSENAQSKMARKLRFEFPMHIPAVHVAAPT